MPFTPNQVGVTSVLVLEEVSGSVIAKGEVVTQRADKAQSLLDLDGTWYSASTPGSALALAHSHSGNDALLGGWFLYSNGIPRWYSIQQGSWESPTVFIGRLFEFDAPPQGCGPTVPGCPKAANAGRHLGWARITAINDSTIHVDAFAGLTTPFDDGLTSIFNGTLNRFRL
jgi:hypothetical protein